MEKRKRFRVGYFYQLFFGAAALISALTVAQWWLQNRQLVAIEEELTQVAADVVHCVAQDGEHCSLQVQRFETNHDGLQIIDQIVDQKQAGTHKTRVLIKKMHPEQIEDMDVDALGAYSCLDVTPQDESSTSERPVSSCEDKPNSCLAKQLKVILEKDTGGQQVLMLKGATGGVKRIPIRTSRSASIIRATLQKGLVASCILLCLGLVVAGWAARRVTRPIRQLSQGVEKLRQGQFGIQVGHTGSGEIGELQRTFNRMSTERASLEEEKAHWQAREHLVELGELARGLGHTLRNPLNALGLVVDQLAGRGQIKDRPQNRDDLIDCARAQIRIIDGWLKSFLAIGASREAQVVRVELSRVLSEVELEVVMAFEQANLQFTKPECELWVDISPHALRAALSNLLSNAIEASSETKPIEVRLASKDPDQAEITIRDHGPGLPAEVREHLFRPHVSTKANGSGMGLYLARQLVEYGMHGSLEIEDHPQGGTLVRLLLPLVPDPTSHPNDKKSSNPISGR